VTRFRGANRGASHEVEWVLLVVLRVSARRAAQNVQILPAEKLSATSISARSVRSAKIDDPTGSAMSMSSPDRVTPLPRSAAQPRLTARGV